MAIDRSAGTEIIRSVNVVDVDGGTWRNLIIGERHHIYTVLSIVVHAYVANSAGNLFQMNMLMYDTTQGAEDGLYILKQPMTSGETFVWDNKFSFMGHQPADFASPTLTTIAEQDAIADQGDTDSPQTLRCLGEHASDNFHVICTYIDQNNE